MTTFTVFCRAFDNQGATWIDTVDTPDGSVDTARKLAEAKCAEAWGCEPEDVVCIGVANAETQIHYWGDLDLGG